MEEQLYEARTHPKMLLKPFVLQLLLLAAHIGLWVYWPKEIGVEFLDNWGHLLVHSIILFIELFYVVVPFLQWRSSIFTLTTKRVYKEWGVLNKNTREIALKHVVSVKSDRSIIDRILGCGTLVFLDASSSGNMNHGRMSRQARKGVGVRFEDIPRIKEVMEMVQKARFGADSED